MTSASGIREYLLTNSPWVDTDKTVDQVLFGDGDMPAAKVGVCWYPSMDTIVAANGAGCELVVTHEPLFWRHRPEEEHWWNREPGTTKYRYLQETGMVVLRAHDSWDQWPDIGIRDSWAAFLGFTNLTFALEKHPHVLGIYDVEPQPLRALAQHIADRVAELGEDSIRVMGDPDRIVSRPSLGVGCCCPSAEIVEAGSDVAIVCYDGASYWESRERLYEMGAAVIAVEHGTSEMPGIENLCAHLAEQFPDTEFQYFAEHPCPWTVTGKA
jgi:putative NIF3 family GTP cyclohydrolase 1 type 2